MSESRTIRGHAVQSQAGPGVPHGGMQRIPGGLDTSDAEHAHIVEQFIEHINRGLALLESGTSLYASDCRPTPGAPIETFDYFDAETGEHVIVWRVACRQQAH